ncbi:MAG: hypothetical protein K2I42_06280 [Anaeroplasmataceae bacterium]|nr:hypothetical protein [Anaeroplasmataceae bacterium]
MDLFRKWLNKKNESSWIQRALTDSSYKNKFQRENREEYKGQINTDLATYGDAIIKFCYTEILLDKSEKLTEERVHYESDKYLVKYVAKQYDLLNYIMKDVKDENLPNDYDYENNASENNNRHKYIATAVEAMIGAIYKEEPDLESLKLQLESWMRLHPYMKD